MNQKKLILNPKLRKTTYPELEELFAFCVNQNLDWDKHIDWTEESLRRISVIILEWTKAGYIIPHKTEDFGTQWRLSIPAFVDTLEVEFNESNFRQLFSHANIGIAGRMGTREEVVAALEDWMATNPSYTWQQVFTETKKFIELKKDRNEQEFIPKCVNFIEKHLKELMENPIKDDKKASDLL